MFKGLEDATMSTVNKILEATEISLSPALLEKRDSKTHVIIRAVVGLVSGMTLHRLLLLKVFSTD